MYFLSFIGVSPITLLKTIGGKTQQTTLGQDGCFGRMVVTLEWQHVPRNTERLHGWTGENQNQGSSVGCTPSWEIPVSKPQKF